MIEIKSYPGINSLYIGIGSAVVLRLGIHFSLNDLGNPVNPFGRSIFCKRLTFVASIVKSAVAILMQIAEQCSNFKPSRFPVNDMIFLPDFLNNTANFLYRQIKTGVRDAFYLQQCPHGS